MLATRRVAVFGGSEASKAPAGDVQCCADHLEQQMFPLDVWGKHYLASRSMSRGDEGEVWRILANHNGTQNTTVPAPEEPLRVLYHGAWVEFVRGKDFEIFASEPVLVGQFLASGSETGLKGPEAGDPAFMLVPAVEQLRADYQFLTPAEFNIHFVIITAPVDVAVSVDGEPLTEEDWDGTTGTGLYRVVRVAIQSGAHTVVADEPVLVMVHGAGAWLSYGYPAGLALPPGRDRGGGQQQRVVCVHQSHLSGRGLHHHERARVGLEPVCRVQAGQWSDRVDRDLR